MASVTSVISFFILLLATYSYSAPITPEYDNVTPQYEFTTGTMMVENEKPVNTHLVHGGEAARVPNLHEGRSLTNLDSEELSRYRGVTRPPRESSEEATTFGGETRSLRENRDSSEESSTPGGETRPLRENRDSTEESSTPGGETRPLRENRDSSEESSTPGDVTRSSRTYESISFPTATIRADSQEKREFDIYSASTMQPESQEKREFDVYSSTMQPDSQEKREFNEYSASTMKPDSQEKRELNEYLSSTMQPDSQEKRELNEYLSSTMQPDSREKREFDVDSLSTVQPGKRDFYQYSTSVMETATDFHKRAIGQSDDSETMEVSTPMYYEQQPETQKNFQPSSSLDSFGQSTGLLRSQQPSDDEPAESFREPNTELKQTIALPSGDFVETKVYSNKKSSTSEELSKSEHSVKYYGNQPNRQI